MCLITLLNKCCYRIAALFLVCVGVLFIGVNSAKAFPQSETAVWVNRRPAPPLIHIVDVQPDEAIMLETENFPPNQDFIVTMGPFGSRGVHGIEVGQFNSGPDGFVQATFPIPVEFQGAHRLAVRARGNGRYAPFSYNWFENMPAALASSSSSGVESLDEQSGAVPLPTTTGLVDILYKDQNNVTARTFYQYDFVNYYNTFDEFADAWLGDAAGSAQLVWLWGSDDNPPEEGSIADASGDFYYALEEPGTESETISPEDVRQNQPLAKVPEAKVQKWRGYALNTLVTLPDLEQSEPGVPSVELVLGEHALPQINSTHSFMADSPLATGILEIMNLRGMIELNELKQGILLVQDSSTGANQNTLVLIADGVTDPARGRNSVTWYSCQTTNSRWGRFRCWVRGYGR